MLQNEFSECSQPVIAERGGQAPAQAAGWRDWQVLARPGGVYRRPHTQDPDAAARRPPRPRPATLDSASLRAAGEERLRGDTGGRRLPESGC